MDALTATILDLPDEVCRIEMRQGMVVAEKGRLVKYDDPLWFEVEPRLETQPGRWRRAIGPFNRCFYFWVAYSGKPGVGVKPDTVRLGPFPPGLPDQFGPRPPG